MAETPIKRISGFHIFLSFLILSISGINFSVASVGINYGQLGDNLPLPENVVTLLTKLKFRQVRIYDTNPLVLKAFANSTIELTVTAENQALESLRDPQQAFQWVAGKIKPFLPATKITGISIGNEVYKSDGDTTMISHLVPAMISVRNALSQLGLASYIHVSSPHSLAVLADSYPPSASSFKNEITPFMSQFLQFLKDNDSPFWINAYPYFAYKNDPTTIPLTYALSNPNPDPKNPNSESIDPVSKLRYDSMLYAQVDSIVFAMRRLGFGSIDVVVTETGWPSKGDSDEIGASVENASAFIRNLVKRQVKNEGTPARPETKLEVYVFALFNEDMKTGPTSERNYGLYRPDETMVYDVGLSSAIVDDSPITGSSSSSLTDFLSFGSSATQVGSESIVYLYLMFASFWIDFQIL